MKQLLVAMYGHVQNDQHVYGLKGNVYRTLKKLKEKGLVNDLPIKNPTYTFYHLTEQGLQTIYRLYDIQYGYRGIGFDDDFGYFDYRIHEPKISAKKESNFHFYYQCWVLCLLMKLNNREELLKELENIRLSGENGEAKEKEITNIHSVEGDVVGEGEKGIPNIHSDKGKTLTTYFDIKQSPTKQLRLTDIKNRLLIDKRITNICSYRDNLHAAPNYKEKDKRFKRTDEYCPDAEIELGAGNNYFIEVDSGTEAASKLYAKFNNLYKRLKALEEAKAPLPKGVIFVTYDTGSDDSLFNVTNQKPRAYDSRHSMTRYLTIYRQFAIKCKNRFGNKFEVLITPIEEFERYIPLLTESNKQSAFNNVQKAMKIYEKYLFPNNETFIWYRLADGWQMAIAKNRKPLPQITLINDAIYLFYRIEGINALAWSEFRAIYQYVLEEQSRTSEPNKKIYPVVYYEHYFPAPPSDEKTSIDETRFHLDTLIVDVGGSQPYWYDKDKDNIKPPFHNFLPPNLKLSD